MKLLEQIKGFFSAEEGKEETKIGLALGGGGARGLAHLGVLEALDEFDLTVDIVTGTSMGAILGASYAQRPEARKVISGVEEYLKENKKDQDYIMKRLGRTGRNRLSKWSSSVSKYYRLIRSSDNIHLLESRVLEKLIEELVEPGDINETEKPFAAAAVDLLSGENIMMDEGSIRDAALASSSLPAVFPPVRNDGRVLVDGGVSCVVPVEQALKLGADFVLAVDVSRDIDKKEAPSRGIDMLFRTTSIVRHQLKVKHLDRANLTIRPDIDDYKWYEFREYDELKERGYRAARKTFEETSILEEEITKVQV